MESAPDPLRDMATVAWSSRLLGRTLVRNSLLKPLDLILDQLERFPEESAERLRAASADEIFAYLDRISEPKFKPGRTKAERISEYVGIFFDQVLDEQNRGDVNRVLHRKRLLRSAYHHYLRQAIPSRTQQAAEVRPDALLDENDISDESGEES